ncbi:hypothetical protein [Methanoregula sp.]|uniref:hypothetical protein n=1 Tax=Methanoregula sp. TaxID=2052170 RepID=UPI003561DA2E
MTAFSTIWRGVRPENRRRLRKMEGRAVLGIGFTSERRVSPSEKKGFPGLHLDKGRVAPGELASGVHRISAGNTETVPEKFPGTIR